MKSHPISFYRESLKAKGWTLRAASPLLGVHFGHLHKVLQGERHSSSLLSRIDRLPARNPSDSRSKLQPR